MQHQLPEQWGGPWADAVLGCINRGAENRSREGVSPLQTADTDAGIPCAELGPRYKTDAERLGRVQKKSHANDVWARGNTFQ